MFSLLWQFCLEKDLVARGNEIFGGISFPRKTFSFGRGNILEQQQIASLPDTNGFIDFIEIAFLRKMYFWCKNA